MVENNFHFHKENSSRSLTMKEWQRFLYISPSATLVLIWNYLMYSQYFFFCSFIAESSLEEVPSPLYSYGYTILISFGYMSFPLFGLLADVWIGRYKAILIGIVLCFIAWIIGGIGFMADKYYSYNIIIVVAYSIVYILEYPGYACFTANIIQYNIDQLVGASADELNSVIYWHTGMEQITLILIYLLQCTFNGTFLTLGVFIASGVSVSLVLVSHSFFKHKLENISLIKNPIKLIVRVLCYARKHKYPENRSALTYWEEEAPSRLDLGKDKYGGPFTEEEVEDVKTVFRMLPIYIAVIAYACVDHNRLPSNENSTLYCYLVTEIEYHICSIFLLLLYLYFIRACFYKYIPSMLTRMSAGLFFCVTTVVSQLVINIFMKDQFVNKMLFIPQTLNSLSFILLYPVSLEFTVAQSPVHMRGVMVGMLYTSWGTGKLINILLKFPFECESQYICTSFYYYITKSVLVLIILIVFVILAKRYKYRVRENEVNIVQIVDDHYQKYIKQEEQYNRKIKSDVILPVISYN